MGTLLGTLCNGDIIVTICVVVTPGSILVDLRTL